VLWKGSAATVKTKKINTEFPDKIVGPEPCPKEARARAIRRE